MKKGIRLLLISLLSTFPLSTFICTQPVHAQGTQNQDIIAIAENTPICVLGSNHKEWNDVQAFNIKPLFDFNNKLVAYSVDLKSNIDNENAYTIISAVEEDTPIIEFCKGHYSPYDNISNNQECIYDGAISYYSKKTNNSINTYYDLHGNKLSDDEVNAYVQFDKNKKYVSTNPELSKVQRKNLTIKNNNPTIKNNLTINSLTSTATQFKSLPVPDYSWRSGCGPTAAAMVLKYDYPVTLENVSSSSLIDQLGAAMLTTSSGSTADFMIPSGITSVMDRYLPSGGEGIRCWNDYDGDGRAANDYGEYCTEIDNDYPVIIYLEKSTSPTTSAYPNGFGYHFVAGVGYSKGNYNFCIVHDTAVEGDVYCNYNSSGFGITRFTYVHYAN